MNVVGLSGNLSNPSKTKALVVAIAAKAARVVGGTERVFDVASASPELGSTLHPGQATGEVAAMLAGLSGADILVAGSPVYKASYTGLFKHAIDLLEPAALQGKPILLCATAKSPGHALVLEHQLTPLFLFFGAAVLPGAIFATDRDFSEDGLPNTPLREKISRLCDGLRRFL